MFDHELKTEFNFSFGYLGHLGETALSLIVRDFIELGAYGVDAAYKTNLETKLTEFSEFPDDQELLGAVVDLREIKDTNADSLRVAIRTMMTKVEKVFPPNSGKWIRFGTKALSQMDDHLLGRCGPRVARMCTKYLAILTPKGVTAALITELEDLSDKFNKSWDEFKDAELERISVTHERIGLANTIYGIITELFDFGKDYWSTRDISKYKAYVIYNTPSGQPELSGDVGTASGTAKDKITLQPVPNGMVSLEFVDNPVSVDPATGKWQRDNVPVECNSVFCMATGHKLFKGSIKINKDVDNNLDILMEPGA
jgi:hypothetical protein